MVGCRSQNIILNTITARQCRFCPSYEVKGLDPPSHNCPKNYTRSSKAIEFDAALSYYEMSLFYSNEKITLHNIVSDDESTMRALLKQACNHPRGRVKEEITDPNWLADPSHRTMLLLNISSH